MFVPSKAQIAIFLCPGANFSDFLSKSDGFRIFSQEIYAYVKGNPVDYSDPTGELPVAIGGALTGAAIDIGIQLLVNGMRPQCIKWDVVLIAAIAGAVNPFSGLNAAASGLKAERQYARAKGLREGSRVAKRTAQRGNSHRSRAVKEAVSWGVIEGGAEVMGNVIPDEMHIRTGDSCECR